MMKLLLLCALIAVSEARVIEPCNDTINIQNVIQKKNTLKTNVDGPYQFAIDYDTSTLFFSYTSNQVNVFESVYIDLKDKSSGIISGVGGGFANAVDNKNKIVYIGGRDGIYKFNYDTKSATNTGITDKNIWQLFYKDGLYFTTYPGEEAFVYKDGVVKNVPELVNTKAMLVAVDNDNNIFYYQGGDLYKIRNGEKKKLGEYVINAFNTDIDGNLYFSTPDSIYRIKDNEIEKVTPLPYISGFAIKSDNTIVYGDTENIFDLEPTDKKCYKTNE